MTRLQGVSRISRRRAAGNLVAQTLLVVGLWSAGPGPGAAQQPVDGPRVTPADVATAAPGIRVSRIRVGPGLELEVAETGPRDGVPIILLHGYTDSWFAWSPVLARLPANVRAIVPSQRGHGDSDRPACCYELADFAADVAALLDSLGIERAHVVGHSMGGLVAQRVAVAYPERVDRLVIIGSAASARNEAVIEFNEFVQKLSDPIDPSFIREFQLSTTALPLPAEFLDGVVRESGKLPARIWRAALGGLVAPEAVHDVSRITAPTLILWGEHDAMFARAGQDHLLRTIPDARLITYPEAAHSPNWEIPDRVVADLARFLGLSSGPDHDQAHAHDHSAPAPAASGVPLYDNLGAHHYPISSRVPRVQEYFDQGLRLYYAFNHAESVRAFAEAARRDDACAMCYWGIALAHGPNINAPMDSAAGVVAYTAIERARERSANASAEERALIAALAVRYAADPTADRATLDSAYARALADVVRRYPESLEAGVLYAESLMDLRPWSYWTRAGEPEPGTNELLATLERVIAANPQHPGACHFYIHAVEAAYPERAVPCAEQLVQLMPGAGHLVHMPGHIYIRVGRYMDAIRANEHAVHADESYIQDQRPGIGIYTAGYYPHNYDFMAFAAAMAGRAGQSLGAATKVRELVAAELLDVPGMTFLQQFVMRPMQFRVRFGQWQEILAEPEPAAGLLHARGLWHYARGRAFVAQGDVARAQAELARLSWITANPALEGVRLEFNEALPVLLIARHVLAGVVAGASGHFDMAIAELRTAAGIEDGLTYGEPPEWPVPVRHDLGAVLLAAGRPADAETAYREDLQRFPANGWSLTGLAASLEQQGRAVEAARVRAEATNALSEADVKLSASRF